MIASARRHCFAATIAAPRALVRVVPRPVVNESGMTSPHHACSVNERPDPAAHLAALREAIERRTSVVIGYVDNHGTRSDRVVDPLSLEGGRLTAHDHRADEPRVFAVHRITSVRPVG